MDDFSLYPLRFEPIFQTYLWGGRRLAEWYPAAPASGPVAEAWLVSDEAAHPSVVRDGPLAGRTLRDLMITAGSRLLGSACPADGRFPLLLKFLDAAAALSLQVHPTDEQAARTQPGARGKTEAWVVLRAAPESRIYAGLKRGVTEKAVRRALTQKQMADCLHTFTPAVGDCVFLAAGTVHAIGAGLLIFEVQQTSDITYRLHDWDRVDARTGQPRPLHVEESLACTNFDFGPCDPVRPVPEAPGRERLVDCSYFRLWRTRVEGEFPVGAAGECRIVVAVDGDARFSARGREYPLRPGDVYLLPAELGDVRCRSLGSATLLEVGLPQCAST